MNKPRLFQALRAFARGATARPRRSLAVVSVCLAVLAGLALWRAWPPLQVEATDPELTLHQGVLHYQGAPLTGVVRNLLHVVQEVHLTSYRDGLRHGAMDAYHVSGTRIASGRYVRGEKHGVFRTWYSDGRDRSYARFENGAPRDQSWGWHRNGRVAQFSEYDDSGRQLVYKQWRRNGRIYINYVLTENGSVAGLPGSKVCEPTSKALPEDQGVAEREPGSGTERQP